MQLEFHGAARTVTGYRHLVRLNGRALLLDCGLVTKHQFGTNYAQFEKSTKLRQHDHFIFNDNGDVIEFYDPRIEEIKATLEKNYSLEVTNYSLTFYGHPKTKK